LKNYPKNWENFKNHRCLLKTFTEFSRGYWILLKEIEEYNKSILRTWPCQKKRLLISSRNRWERGLKKWSPSNGFQTSLDPLIMTPLLDWRDEGVGIGKRHEVTGFRPLLAGAYYGALYCTVATFQIKQLSLTVLYYIRVNIKGGER